MMCEASSPTIFSVRFDTQSSVEPVASLHAGRCAAAALLGVQ